MASYQHTKFLSVELKSHHKPLDGQKERSSDNYHFSEICEGSKILWKCPEGVTFDVKRDKSGKDPVLLTGVRNNHISDYIDSDDVYIANPSGCSEDFSIEVFSIFASNRQKWISETIDRSTPIKNIVLPGTHDSAAIRRVRYGVDPWACQNVSIYNQLQAGIRLLDIRLKAKECNGTVSFVTCHGDFGPNEFEQFTKVVSACKSFLDCNSGEFIVMSIKIDDYNEVDNKKANDALNALLFETCNNLFDRFSNQTLAEAENKIIVIDRYDTTGWKDNTTFSFDYYGTEIHVQDKYNCDKDTKVKAIDDAMEYSLEDTHQNDVCINFCSGYEGYEIISGIEIPRKHDLISDVIELFGKKICSASQSANLGWFLFDYVFSTYYVKLNDGSVELIDIVDLIVDANCKTHKYYGCYLSNEL